MTVEEPPLSVVLRSPQRQRLGAGGMGWTARSASASSTDRFNHPRWGGSILCSLVAHAASIALLIGTVTGASSGEAEASIAIHVDQFDAPPESAVQQEVRASLDVDHTTAKPDQAAQPVGLDREEQVEACSNEVSEGSAPIATMAEWRQLLQHHFARYKQFPPQALRSRHEGTSLVFLTVCRDGYVRHSRLVQSSGIEVLDQESLQLVQRASPLPGLPAEYADKSIDVVVPIEFSVVR